MFSKLHSNFKRSIHYIVLDIKFGGRPLRGVKNRLIGIELDAEVANWTRKRLRKYRNVTIISGDAVENIPIKGTLFYM